MGHKLLFTVILVAALASPRARASSDGPHRYQMAAAVEALMAVGARYRYGGSSPDTGFDCSGLVAHVYEQAWGIFLPRRAEEQRKVGHPVKLAELQPGDLVFYNTRHRPFSHVGIYLGDGNFVHAPRRGRRVTVENLHTRYWQARFNGARRLDPPAD